MEHLQGQDLAALVRAKGKLSWQRTRGIALQMVRALKAAHAKGIIHRDIKPANILLDASGACVIADLGMSRFQDESRRTLSGLGTPTYVAPEVTSGHYGTSADMWSFGLVVVEMCVGVADKSKAAEAAAADRESGG